MPSSVRAVGVFLASEDPSQLISWYKALGVPLGDEGYCFVGGDGSPEGGGVFSVMQAATRLAAPPDDPVEEEPYGRRRVTLNLRVDDIEAAVAGLRSRGTAVVGPKDHGYGIFAWCHDPDRNIVELWQPATTPA